MLKDIQITYLRTKKYGKMVFKYCSADKNRLIKTKNWQTDSHRRCWRIMRNYLHSSKTHPRMVIISKEKVNYEGRRIITSFHGVKIDFKCEKRKWYTTIYNRLRNLIGY